MLLRHIRLNQDVWFKTRPQQLFVVFLFVVFSFALHKTSTHLLPQLRRHTQTHKYTHVHTQTGLCCSCCFFVVVLEVSRSCVSSCLTETLPLPFPYTAVCFTCCKNEMCLRLTRKTRNTEATSTTWTVSREGMSNSFYTIGHIQPTLILNVFLLLFFLCVF